MPFPAAAPDPKSSISDPARLAALRESGLLHAEPSESFDRLTRLAARLLGVPVAFVSLVDADRRVLLSATGLSGAWAGLHETPLAHSLCSHVVDRSAPLIVEDARNVAHLDDTVIAAQDVIAFAGMPLTTADGHTLGALCAVDAAPRRWLQHDLDALADLAAAVASELELRSLAGRLDAEMLTDPVTGLPNRRAWEQRGPRELARARELEQPLVLALLSLDRFKRFNDRRGHQAGDALLRELTEDWRSALCEGDMLLRLGGVEFALLMPGRGLDPAFDVVHGLRGSLTSGMTCSAGLATLRGGESHGELLARADAALSRAKRSGRNSSALST